MNARTERWIATAIIVAHVGLALGVAASPVFESQEELQHTLFVRFLKQFRTLPNPDLPWGGYQSIQAPLYYGLAAAVTAPIDETDFEAVMGARNPYYGADIAGTGNDNKNLRLHGREQEFPFPDSPTVQAVLLMRLLAIALNTAMLILSNWIYRILWPDRPYLRLAALGIASFWPAALYYLTLVGNDVMVAFAGTLVLWLALRQHQRGPTWRSAMALGVGLGIAMLSKGNAVFLALPLGAATIFDRRFWKLAPISVGTMVLIAGWWYARNLTLWGDLNAITVDHAHAPDHRVLPGSQTLGMWTARMLSTYETVWARFGLDNIGITDSMRLLYDIMLLVAALGLACRALKTLRQVKTSDLAKLQRLPITIVALYAFAWIAALGYLITVQTTTGQYGRHYLPGVTAWAAMLALGLDFWIPPRFKARVALSVAAIYGTLSALAVFGFLLPAYRPLPAPSRIEHSLSYTYENAATLIGIDPPDSRLRPGESGYVTLHWRAIAPTDNNLVVGLHSVDTDDQTGVVRRDSYPATGNLLSTEWLAGQTWSERYRIEIPADAQPQFVHLLMVSLYDPQADRALSVTGPDGAQTLPVVGRLIIHGPAAPFEPDYRFGDVIGLRQPEVTRSFQQITVCLRWVSLARTDVDYIAFVHFLASDGALAAQSDFQAGGANYPSSVWLVGESPSNCVTMPEKSLPPAGWRMAIGLYDLANGQRLSATDKSGNALQDNVAIVNP